MLPVIYDGTGALKQQRRVIDLPIGPPVVHAVVG